MASQTSGDEDAGPEPVGRLVTAPPPAEPPHYDRPPGKIAGRRPWTVEDALDGGFFLVGTLLTLWLAWILLTREVSLSWEAIAYVVAFWLLLAYVGIPRLQEVLSRIYVPDYFIGRTVTGIGVLGDPVNLALDGSADDLHAAMRRAGWVVADDLTLRTSWAITVAAALRRSYAAAPVSPLLLFGRRQAFAYEQQVDDNPAQRHHVRFWPVPDGWVLPGGHRVDWLAAATYDRAVGLSMFTLQVTHKVDADVDVERDYVVDTVRYTTPEAPLRIIDDFSTAFHSRNGGGDIVRTDGNLPVLVLSGTSSPAPTEPAGGAGAGTLTSRLLGMRLPPAALLLVGALCLLKLGLATATLALEADRRWTAWLAVGSAGTLLVLWLITLAGHRWARTALMALGAVEATLQLEALSGSANLGLGTLVTGSLSTVILVAASSAAARRWVTSPRRPAC